MLAREPVPYGWSSFSSAIGALVGELRDPMIGGDVGLDSAVESMIQEEETTINVNITKNNTIL